MARTYRAVFFMVKLLQALQHLSAEPGDNSYAVLANIVDALRPGLGKPPSHAAVHVRKLVEYLNQHPEFRTHLSAHVRYAFQHASFTRLFCEAGLLPSDDFFSEAFRRIRHRILPEVPEYDQMDDVLAVIFRKPLDFIWVKAVPATLWLDLWILLEGQLNVIRTEDLDNSLKTLSHRLAALGNEREIIRRTPKSISVEPIFLQQVALMLDVLDGKLEKIDELYELLDSCDKLVQLIIEDRSHQGVGLSLSYRLRRIQQHIERIRKLLKILQKGEQPGEPGFPFFVELLEGVNTKNLLFRHINENVGMLAFQVVEHTGETGSHYITTGVKDYYAFLWSSMKGGFIVGFMTVFKVMLGWLHLAPMIQALAYSLNYASGFITIHMTHSALATKQPAMTASAITAAYDKQRKEKDPENSALVLLLARVFRSQFISFVGNLIICFPMGMALAAMYYWISGSHLTSESKAWHLIMDQHPTKSGALIFAAVTGVYLYLSGLISGYFDNLMVFRHIPERLYRHRLLTSIMSDQKRRKFVNYLEEHMGALAGNFFLGFFLGSTHILGEFMGIPIDIRHITVSAAGFGIGMFDSGFILNGAEIAVISLGILGIGFFNFSVSFGLAFLTAMRSRGIERSEVHQLMLQTLKKFFRKPLIFFFPVQENKTQQSEPELNH